MEILSSHQEEQYTLSGKQLEALTQLLQPVPAIDVSSDQPVSRQVIREQLGTFVYLDTFLTSGGTNRLRPIVTDGILGREARGEGYIHGIARDSTVSLVHAATEASSNRKAALVFRMVYGGTQQASLRALSYPLPALQAMNRVNKATDVPTYLQVVFANNISGVLNSLHAGRVAEESAAIADGVVHIAQQIGLSDRVGFYDDSLVDLDEIHRTGKMFENTAPNQLLGMLSVKGPNDERGSTGRYAAAHYVLHDSPDSQLQHIAGTEPPLGAQAVIDIGGIQEKYFRAARLFIGFALDSEVQVPQVYTRHRVPPYYMAREGDIALREFMVRPHVDRDKLAPAARADIAYLEQVVDLGRLYEETYHA